MVCVSKAVQAGMAAKAAVATAVGTDGASIGRSTRQEDAVPLTEAELEELAKIAAECRAKERAKERVKELVKERVKELENAWRDVEIVMSDVVQFYTYDPSKAVPAEKQPPGPAAGATG